MNKIYCIILLMFLNGCATVSNECYNYIQAIDTPKEIPNNMAIIIGDKIQVDKNGETFVKEYISGRNSIALLKRVCEK